MKNTHQYTGKNPIPGPKPFGIKKDAATPVAANAAVATAACPPATDAAVAITSIEAKADAKPDANVVIAAKAPTDAVKAEDATKPLAKVEAKVDALENVKSGEQILADTTKPAASTRQKS